MKKLTLSLLFLAATMAVGTGLRAQEVTRTLMPGWTWISCPTTDTMDFATAMGSFVPMPYDIITTQGGAALYMNGRWTGSVSKFYPGYGYHYKSNRTEPVTVAFQTQQPSSQVAVATLEPADVTAVSAVVGGNVTINAGNHIFARGVCWGTEEMPNVDGSHMSGDLVAGSLSVTLTDLAPSTTYHVRAYMVTDYGLSYGDQRTFTTLGGIPSVTTAAVTGILGDGATCGGTVTDGGGLDVTARGVCWSMSHNPTLSDSHTTDGTGTGSFVSLLTGLSTSTTYYVRAYATTAQATAYGEELTFTTMNGIPAVTTAEVADITTNTAICGGTVTADGGLAITARGVCWGTIPNPTLSGSHTTDGTGTGSFTSSLTSLSASTTYYVRAYATNSHVTVYGNQRTFTTEPLPSYTVTVSSNPTEGGTATGGGTYEQGQSCTVTATANTGYTFANWTENGSQVSTNATYTFTVNADRTLVANFTYNGGGNAPTGAIDGLFSVSATQQVYFSQGNLQYQASTHTWRFADNQYDYVGEANSNISSTYSGWIDLFGWGTSGWNCGNTYYHPWDSNTSGGGRSYGPPSNNLTGSYANADWGIYNPISNGDNTVNHWRTMTITEWRYVFYNRSTNSGIRYAKAKVNNINGVILLPDDWSTSTYSLSNTNNSAASFISNTITATQWITLESAGAIFLPVAGYRDGTSLNVVNFQGSYWSASRYSDIDFAYGVFFSDNTLVMDNHYYGFRCFGFSVRLVRDAE